MGYSAFDESDGSEQQPANQAIVFLVKGVNDPLMLPVAYFFINSLNGEQRASILTSILMAVSSCNVRISNITFDGYAANFAMCEILGADLNPFSDSFKTFIINPFDKKPIYIIADPSHMEKLVRNTLASKEIIIDEQNGQVKWDYFVELEKCNRESGFAIVNKLNRKHIDWQQRKMKVRIAVETLSASVADSMEFLMVQGHPEFKDAQATITFIRHFNNLFDILNSRSMQSTTKYKNPLSPQNEKEIFSYLDTVDQYIKGLKLRFTPKKRNTRSNSRSIFKTRSKTAFRGFIINIESLKGIYAENVNSNILKIFPTFMLSQDFVELFFCKIRSLHGFNDNPTVVQFMSAYKKLLSSANILASYDANVKVFKSINMTSFIDILSISSKRPTLGEGVNEKNISEIVAKNEEIIESELKLIAQNTSTSSLSDVMHTASVASIASLIEQRILQTENAYCKQCQLVLIENSKIENNLMVSKSALVPCKSTYEICKKVNDYLKLIEHLNPEKNINFNAIYLTVFQHLNIERLFEKSDFSDHADHKFFFVKKIVNEYIRIKLNYIAKSRTLIAQGKSLRTRLHKWIHFTGQ